MAIVPVAPGVGTLSAAIAAANAGDILQLSAGVYSDDTGVSVDVDDVSIIGPNAGINPNTGVRVPEAEIQQIRIYDGGALNPTIGLTVDGVLFTGSPNGTGAFFHNAGGYWADLLIQNCIFRPGAIGSAADIQLGGVGNTNLTIIDNLFDGVNCKGLGVRSNLNVWGVAGLYIHRNVSVDSDYAFLQLQDNADDPLVNCTVCSNIVRDADRKGIQVGDYCHNLIIEDNLLERCNDENNATHGGLRLYGEGRQSGIVVRRNVVRETYNSFAFISDNYGPVSGYEIYDNIVIDSLNADVLNDGLSGLVAFGCNEWRDSVDNIANEVQGPSYVALVITYAECVAEEPGGGGRALVGGGPGHYPTARGRSVPVARDGDFLAFRGSPLIGPNTGLLNGANYTGDTTDATPTALEFPTNQQRLMGTDTFELLDDTVYSVTAAVSGRQDNGDAVVVHIRGAIKRGTGAGSVALVGAQVVEALYDGLATATAALVADTVNGSVGVQVTGEAASNINWSARVRVLEVQ